MMMVIIIILKNWHILGIISLSPTSVDNYVYIEYSAPGSLIMQTCRVLFNFITSRRHFSSNGTLDLPTFHRLADHLLDHLHDSLDTLLDSHPQADSFDTSLSMGVLTVKLATLGTFVVNKQPPNMQIWLSSPVSGPSRFDFDQDRKEWIYKRNGTELVCLLNSELTDLLKQPVKLNIPKLYK